MPEDAYHKQMRKREVVKLYFLLLCAILCIIMIYIHINPWISVAITAVVYILGAERLVIKCGLPRLPKTPDHFDKEDSNVHEEACNSPTCTKYDPNLANARRDYYLDSKIDTKVDYD